jgi:hypothetical protein
VLPLNDFNASDIVVDKVEQILANEADIREHLTGVRDQTVKSAYESYSIIEDLYKNQGD